MSSGTRSRDRTSASVRAVDSGVITRTCCPSESPCSSADYARSLRSPEPERRHLLTVAYENHVADEHRMIPRPSRQRGNTSQLGESVGRCPHECDVAFLRHHEEHILVW